MLTFSSDITGKEISLGKTISKVEAISIVLVSLEICLSSKCRVAYNKCTSVFK